MERKKKVILIVLGIIAVIAVGILLYLQSLKPHNLEEYIEKHREAENMIGSFCETCYDGSKMEVSVEKNTIRYQYQYKESIDEDIMEQIQQQFDIYGDSMENIYHEIVKTLKSESGFSDIHIELRFLNAQGEEIYRKEFR